jgi:DNA uptake protein ComE-like DNA-binding protein
MTSVKFMTLAALTASVMVTVPLVSVAIATGGQAGESSSTASRPLPGGQGKAVMEQMCVSCHALSVVTSKRATPAEWSALVQQMVTRGATGSDQDVATLTQYLAKNFGPGAPVYALPAAAPVVPTAMLDQSAEASSAEPKPKQISTIHVNVNGAGVRELESALLLTQEEAQTLIAYRQQNGEFRNWQEVGEIPGVPAGKIIEYQNRIEF